MPENTPNLDLYLKNPVTDGTDTFNIETMLNENFRKIDEKTARVGLDGKLDPTQRAAPAIVTVAGDLDTYKTPGSYYVPTGITNTPFTTNSYYMQVYAEGLLVMQVLYGRVNPNLMFMRRFNGTWGEWDNYSKGIANGIALQDDVTTHLADDTAHVKYGADTGTANAKVVTLTPAPTAYVEGMAFAFKNLVANTGAVTVNVNGLGTVPVVKSNGNALTSDNLKAGSIYTVRKGTTSFILQGEGGEYGTAIADDVLTGKTIGTENGIVAGTLTPGKRRATGTITSAAANASFPDRTGANATSSYVAFNFANLPFIPSVIYFTLTNKATLGYPTIYLKDDYYYFNATNYANVSTGSAGAFRVPYVNGVVNIPVNFGTSASITWVADEQ